MPEVGGFVALVTGTEVRERPTPTCCVCGALVWTWCLVESRGRKYSCEDLGRGDVLVGREAEAAVASVGDYGDEAREATEEAWSPGPGVHFH